MFSRFRPYPEGQSFFLLGPRGTGKSFWIRQQFPQAIFIDLLDAATFNRLLANPGALSQQIPDSFSGWVAIDEIQKIPALLDEVHRLIETKHFKFILSGSSARKLKRGGANLLAGRALALHMFPMTVGELGNIFSLAHSLRFGHLPTSFGHADPAAYLSSYVQLYLREEIQAEGLTRNLSAFGRFLEKASFSQAAVLSISEVARECQVDRKAVENYFSILEDLLLADRLPVFTKKAKRKMVSHPKFYFFDVGVYRALRPRGPLDSPEEIDGAALETLVYQELKAVNQLYKLGYQLYYWRTADKAEIDFILYGDAGILAIEVKRSRSVHPSQLRALKSFLNDFPGSKALLLYGGDTRLFIDQVQAIPIEIALKELPALLSTAPQQNQTPSAMA